MAAKAKTKAKKAGPKKVKAKKTTTKKGRAKLSPENAAEVRKLLRRVRELGEEARNGKKGGQRKLVF